MRSKWRAEVIFRLTCMRVSYEFVPVLVILFRCNAYWMKAWWSFIIYARRVEHTTTEFGKYALQPSSFRINLPEPETIVAREHTRTHTHTVDAIRINRSNVSAAHLKTAWAVKRNVHKASFQIQISGSWAYRFESFIQSNIHAHAHPNTLRSARYHSFAYMV